MPTKMDKLVEFKTDGHRVICNRCGRDISSSVKILGNETMCRAFHTFAHVFEDVEDDQDRMNITVALDLMVQGTSFNR